MKFTLSWLKDHLETNASIDEICHQLNMIGLEVEHIENPQKTYGDFSVCEIIEVNKHPNADKLNLCKLNTKFGDSEVVCGAPNVRVGMKAVFAPEGSYIPGSGIKLQATTIRGVKSNGMLLSERELSLSDDHDGILELDKNANIGDEILGYIKKSDPVIEIAITPNRADALGVRGIARDLSAAGIGELKNLEIPKIKEDFEIEKNIILNEDASENVYASFRLIRNVKNGESPKWLKDRLETIGLRSINKLVDVTNYLTFDLCRPLHVFDYDKINNFLEIRKAKDAEKMLALDDKEYILNNNHVVLADDNGPESIAGIIGGKSSGSDEGTVNVLVEAVTWDKINIAQTGRDLGINSDARYRNERGIDKSFNDIGLDIATDMINTLCGGENSKVISLGTRTKENNKINFRLSEIERLLGVKIAENEVSDILSRLGFLVKKNNQTLELEIPSWRNDIYEQACIVEEIMRIKGTDNIKSISMNKSVGVASRKITNIQKARSQIKRILASRGMMETVNYSFISDKYAAHFIDTNNELRLINPISSELNILRQSLLPSLINSIKKNLDRGHKDISLFEVSHSFMGVEADQQVDTAAGIRVGKAISHGGNDDWRGKKENYNVFDVKEDVLTVLRAQGIEDTNYTISIGDMPKYYHPGKSGALCQGPKKVLAYFGELHPTIASLFDLDQTLYAFEIFPNSYITNRRVKSRVRPGFNSSQFMPLHRDFAFTFDKEVHAEEIIITIRKLKNTLISDIKIFDVYTGENIPKDKKSIGINLEIQPYEKTLTEAEIDELSAIIINEISKKFSATIRN